MAENRSQLLMMSLPDDLAQRVAAEGVDLKNAWLVTSTDLNLGGSYEQVYLVAEPDRLVTVGMPSADGRTAVRILLQRNKISEIRTRQGVGGGFLEALVDGIYVEVLAFSNVRADAFHKVTAKLKDWLNGETPAVTAEDDYDPLRCPKCGMPLDYKGDMCRRCIDHGAVFMRSLKMMRPYASKAILMFGLVLITIGLSLVPQQLVRLLIDKVLAPGQAKNPVLEHNVATQWLLMLVAALIATHVFIAFINMISGRLSSFVGTQVTYDMRSRVFRHLTNLSIGYYDRYNVGQLMSRVASDTEQMRAFVQQLTGGFMAQIITVVVVGFMLFSVNWRLAVITLIPAPLVAASAIVYWKRIYPRYYRVWDAGSKLWGALNSILSGVRVVKAFGQEEREQNRFSRSSSYVRDSARGVEYSVNIFNPCIGLLFQFGGFLVWFFGGKMVLGSSMTLGELMLYFGYLGMFYAPLGSLTQLTTWLTGFLTAAQRTFEILDTAPQIGEAAQPVALPDTGGHIVYDGVVFGYSRHEPIIKGVTFEIKPGEHVGVVGKSGSGKTTLVNLVARFYDVDEGRIMINGVDVRDMKADDLRGYVGVVLQEPFLFRGTIYANIAYGRPDATPEDVLDAAKSANAHNFIIRHPLGYDTYIGERGAGLSGGERQRISIARALLYDPKILILDEATSNVDTESELLIQQALERVTRGRTTIAIAHRLSTLKNCDRIIVVDDGRIIENGSHDDLMKLGGMYCKLVKIQTELSRDTNIDMLNAVQKK